MLAAAESVRDLVVATRFMPKGEGKLLKNFVPSRMSGVEFLLGVEELEGIVIAIEGEFVMEKVMPPVPPGLDDGVKLQIIVGVPHLRLV